MFPIDSPRALVADDDEFFRIALKGILTRQLGISSVVEAGSFDDAMEQLGGSPGMTVALFDLSMPGITSAANLSAVRECAPSTKLIVVSGSTARRDIMLSLGAGVHGYVPKSLGPAKLADALQSVMDGAIYVPPSIADIGSDPIDDDEAAPVRAARRPMSHLLTSLTARQVDVLKLLVQGHGNKDIARALNLGEGTVKIHVAALFRSLKVLNRSAAAAVGARLLDADI